MEIELIEQYFASLSIPHFVAIGLLLFALILFLSSNAKQRKEQKLLLKAPKLLLKDFQVAPLGKDAFFKIRNEGEAATISQLDIIGRADLMVKNDYAGHQIDRDKEYRIFLESAGHQKIEKDFSIEITFAGPNGHIYKQIVPLSSTETSQLTIIRKS